MKDLISIIINVYNGEKYIDRCLDIVINQTYKNLEILIINDGSVDNTFKLCKKYKDKRIKIITTENQGLSLSRNVGLDNATGKYIYFLDVDDYIEKDTIEYLYKLSKKYKSKFVMSKSLDIRDYNFTYKNKPEKIKFISKEDMLSDIVLEKNNAVTSWNKLIDAGLYKNLRFEKRIINDMNYTHKLVMRSDGVLYSNQIKYFYLKRNDSVSGKTSSKERLIDIYEVSLNRYKYIKREYPKLIDNDAGMLRIIINIYLKDRINDYLDKVNFRDTYNEIFSLKILFSRVGFREKIKMILFRTNPKLNKNLINIYLKLLGKK